MPSSAGKISNTDLPIVDRMRHDGDAPHIVAALNQLPERAAFIMVTAQGTPRKTLIDGRTAGAKIILASLRATEFIARVRGRTGGGGIDY